jgi:hypothetical protein
MFTQTANEIIVTQNSNQNLNQIGLYSVSWKFNKTDKKSRKSNGDSHSSGCLPACTLFRLLSPQNAFQKK